MATPKTKTQPTQANLPAAWADVPSIENTAASPELGFIIRPNEVFGVPCRILAVRLGTFKYGEEAPKEEWEFEVEFAGDPEHHIVRYGGAYLAGQAARMLENNLVVKIGEDTDGVKGVVGAFDQDKSITTKIGNHNPIRFLPMRSRREPPNNGVDEVFIGEEAIEAARAEKKRQKGK
jgi:hypothetical protein